MNFFQAIILGIIEGLTEFLPISSTAHLIIANRLLAISITDFVKSFDIIIQLGAILAVVVLYARRLLLDRPTLQKIIVAFIPTAIIGFFLYPFIKNNLLENIPLMAYALIIGGIIMIIFEYKKPTQKLEKHISYYRALLIGFFQSLAIIPGVSRAGATIIGGQSLGISRKTIVEFSFLLAIPTMIAASGLDVIKSDFKFTTYEWSLLAVGFVTAFITALLAVRFFLRYIEKHSFSAFGWYRIIIGLLILFLLM
ncbi:undecaprenyl-diphosphate phosphatase [Candidatus Falkowbacteria bacterium]|nr:MAG: undecaprenyl-diphosphate phosphatase [Candidatus Falkowbacteria bacterium]